MATDEDIETSVRRLGEEFSLSDRAERLLRLYYEVLLFEVSRPEEVRNVTVEIIEKFMRRTARNYLYRRRIGALPIDDRKITAAALLHMGWWRTHRYPYLVRFQLDARDPEEAEINAILDKD